MREGEESQGYDVAVGVLFQESGKMKTYVGPQGHVLRREGESLFSRLTLSISL